MRIIRLKDVIDSTGIARSTIYKLIGEGGFPKPVPLVGRSVGWVESEVHEWIRQDSAARSQLSFDSRTVSVDSVSQGKRMNIQQAITRSRIQRGVGGALLLSGATFYFVSLLMAIYRTAQAMSNSALLWQLGAVIQNFIAALYQATSPYIGFVWRNVPTINQTDPFTYGNLLFLGLVGVMIVGKQLVLAGRRLKARIQRQIDRVEDLQWRNSMMQSRVVADTTISAGNIGQVNVFQQPMPPSPEGEWWSRPWGVIGLSIISGYIVAVMAKLTGML